MGHHKEKRKQKSSKAISLSYPNLWSDIISEAETFDANRAAEKTFMEDELEYLKAKRRNTKTTQSQKPSTLKLMVDINVVSP